MLYLKRKENPLKSGRQYQGRKHQPVSSIYSVLSSYSFRNHSCHHLCNCTNGPYPDTPGIHLKANFIRSSAVEESFLSQEHPVIRDTVTTAPCGETSMDEWSKAAAGFQLGHLDFWRTKSLQQQRSKSKVSMAV